VEHQHWEWQTRNHTTYTNGDDWGMVYYCFTRIIQKYPSMGNYQHDYDSPAIIIQKLG
jgi:hypothetical protein